VVADLLPLREIPRELTGRVERVAEEKRKTDTGEVPEKDISDGGRSDAAEVDSRGGDQLSSAVNITWEERE
jgi:hypothetical protein